MDVKDELLRDCETQDWVQNFNVLTAHSDATVLKRQQGGHIGEAEILVVWGGEGWRNWLKFSRQNHDPQTPICSSDPQALHPSQVTVLYRNGRKSYSRCGLSKNTTTKVGTDKRYFWSETWTSPLCLSFTWRPKMLTFGQQGQRKVMVELRPMG